MIDTPLPPGQGRRSRPGTTVLRPATDGHRARGALLRVIAAAAAMGTLGPVAAAGYGAGLAPATLSALRAGIGCAILAGLVLAHRQPAIDLARLDLRQRVRLGLAVVANGAMNLVLFFAFGAMAVGLVMVLFYGYPLLVAIMSAVLGRERLTAVRVVALAIAGGGIALVLSNQLGPEAHATVLGVGLALAAATCQAIYYVVIRHGFDDVPGVQATAIVLGGGFLISGAAAVSLEGLAVDSGWLGSPVAWAAVLCAATVGAVPKVWVISGIRLIGSTRAAVAMLLEPIVAVVVAALALGQDLTLVEIAGAAAILTAVVLVQLPERGARPRARGSADPAVSGA